MSPKGLSKNSAKKSTPFGRKKRLRDRLHVSVYILPNLLTTMNMFFGFFAIIMSIQDNFLMAAYAIVAAAIFDLLDGRVARMTNSMSEFGAQYDSLSDLVSFGVAPGVLLFLWALEPFGRLGWLASFFLVACAALRLARFNVQKQVLSDAYFQGLPSPMSAGIVASSVLAFTDLELEPSRSIGLLLMTFLLGITMVSSFPYRSFKDLDFKRRLPFFYLVFGVFLFAVIAMRPEVMLFVTFMTYALLGAIFGVLKLGRPHRAAIRRPSSSNSDSDSDDEAYDDDNYGDNYDDNYGDNYDDNYGDDYENDTYDDDYGDDNSDGDSDGDSDDDSDDVSDVKSHEKNK